MVSFLIVDELICKELLNEDKGFFNNLIIADARRAICFHHYVVIIKVCCRLKLNLFII